MFEIITCGFAGFLAAGALGALVGAVVFREAKTPRPVSLPPRPPRPPEL